MNIIAGVKAAAALVTTISAGSVVGNIIKASTPENMKLAGKIGVAIGGFVLAAVAGDLAASYVEAQIDEGEAAVKWAKEKRAEAKAAAQAEAPAETPEYPAPGAELDDEEQN